MDWIIQNLIANKRNNYLIYWVLIGIYILDFINDQLGFIEEKYLIIDFSLYALVLLAIKEILNYWYRSLYRKNESIIKIIRQLSDEGDHAKIIEQAKRIKTIKPQITEKTYWIGSANLYLNNPQKALQDFDSIESDYANFSGFFYMKGITLIELGENKKAIEYLTRSIELEKTWRNVDQRGVAYMKIDKLEESENDLRDSVNMKLSSSNTCNLGVLMSIKGKYKEALEFYNQSIEIKSDNANALHNRALANYYLKNYQDSISSMTKTIEIQPLREWSYYYRALSYQKINKFEEAIKDYNKAEGLSIENRNLYLNRGYCKCEYGDISNGLIDLNKASDFECEEAEELIEKYKKQ
jgi:tetratricopeptide (TPR) repeat protein